MNCKDIARIADSGTFSKLGSAERHAAEAHALTCPQCAPIWAVHSRLAVIVNPTMLMEKAALIRTLAALQPQARGGHTLRRLTLIGSVVALAAAAGMGIWPLSNSHTPPPAAAVVATPPAAGAALGSALETAVPSVPEIIAPDTESKEEADATRFAQLPLVPEPAEHIQDPDKLSLALRKALERHPELKQGPELDDASIFFVLLAMRADGAVLNSTAELGSPATSTEISERLQRTLPSGGGDSLVSFLTKGQQLPGGGAARAGVFLRAMIIRDDFDMAHSDVRVREILGHQYDYLGVPHASDESNMLTVLLSEDGRILSEKVDLFTAQNSATTLKGIASTLGVDIDKIGAIGTTRLEQGNPRMVLDEEGFSRIEGLRSVFVRYAWERRSGDSAPVRSPVRAPADEADFDLNAALTVVKQLFPDAFSRADPAPKVFLMPMPTVVFTAKGEVINAGRVQIRNGVSPDKPLRQQLVPGISTGLVHRTVRLTDKAGATAIVHFAWESQR